MKVLIADDAARLRQHLSEAISAIKRIESVAQAQDVSEACESVRRFHHDLVLLDIQMPGGSGIDVLREVKQKSPATTVIMFTNYSDPQYQQKCVELGADHFLSKSRDFKQLIKIVEELAVSKGANPVE